MSTGYDSKQRQVLRSQLDTAQYEREDLAWYHTACLEYFWFAFDTSFYDRKNKRYRLEETLDEGEAQFGGYDLLVVWPTYPRLGVDERNQFDYYRDMPGGLEGVRDLVQRAHGRGVRVLVEYNPWDIGTRREGKSDVEALSELVAATDADGIFLDTMFAASAELREALDKIRPGLIFETEATPYAPQQILSYPLDSAKICTGSWGQTSVPSPGEVLDLKWIEPRFSMRGVDRNANGRSSLIALFFFHGTGHVLWEDIFGWWNPFTLEDRIILSRCISLLRAYSSAFLDPDWEPYLDTLLPEEISAHKWRTGQKTVYTLYNHRGRDVHEAVITLPVGDNMEVYDVWNGGKAEKSPIGDGSVTVSLRIDSLRCGCLVVQPRDEPPPVFREAPAISDKPAYHRVGEEAHLPLPVQPSEPGSSKEIPDGMVLVPGGRTTLMIDTAFGTRYTHPAYDGISSDHALSLEIMSYLMEITEVTNAQYKDFLNSARYRPAVMKNFLKHWITPDPDESDPGLWQIPAGKENHPVVYVDLDDARAYARWAKRRLPTEEEWQYAAQGNDRTRRWPWGKDFNPDFCNGPDTSVQDNSKSESVFGDTTPVDAYPDGASPFGCLDMSGNVWEWTESERDDGHSRYAILKGGSHFVAGGSGYYMAGGAQPCRRHSVMLLMYPGLDRCSTIGFRCVKDMQ